VSLVATVVLLSIARPGAGQVRVGPLFGYSFLAETDTSLSHGPLDDEATVGRSWLVGGVLDARLTEHDVLSAEFSIGPYHDDVDRYTIVHGTTFDAQPFVAHQTSNALIVGLQYARIMGHGSWRPYVGGGLGFKRYDFQSSFEDADTCPLVAATAGIRSVGRRPVRLEVVALVVWEHPILPDERQFELQARVVALLF